MRNRFDEKQTGAATVRAAGTIRYGGARIRRTMGNDWNVSLRGEDLGNFDSLAEAEMAIDARKVEALTIAELCDDTGHSYTDRRMREAEGRGHLDNVAERAEHWWQEPAGSDCVNDPNW